MAFTSDYKGTIPMGGAEIHWGNWDATGATSGTIDIRPTSGGSPVDFAGQIVWAGCTNAVGVVVGAVVAKTSGSTVLAGKPVGTIAIAGVTAGDRGTWMAVVA